ncbi:phosphogluconate dehydrogenase C-terminal domain-containing protein [Ulvibacterium sp.]|uniref:phosphogluconate dehydrogenase C-terminal domain-containing protein n=1 Tax=Ulvibacterium sp. TaxID=2665914 RepID=UPI00262E38CA|nr:phosphogluconate dehydrogenase C-terminal domain-containing protein [Ulvibacterium sp.]
MDKVALVGAGGKMGMRCTDNLLHSDYEVDYLEVSGEAITRLREKGVEIANRDIALAQADMVILAVPDIAIRSVSNEIIPKMKSGSMVICLDPAAPLAGHLPHREDLAYYVTHPAHPSVFNWEPTEEAHFDYYGGIAAKQTVVSAIMHGTDQDFEKGDRLTRTIFSPVTVNHRITVEQMAILEPGFSETLSSTCIKKIRDALDVVVAKGVPEAAARDFILGHINIQLAVLFGELPIKFSDAAIKALERAENILFKEGWEDIFEMDNIHEQIKAITE